MWQVPSRLRFQGGHEAMSQQRMLAHNVEPPLHIRCRSLKSGRSLQRRGTSQLLQESDNAMVFTDDSPFFPIAPPPPPQKKGVFAKGNVCAIKAK